MSRAQIQLTVKGKPLALNLTVPEGTVALGAMLPAFQKAAEALIERGIGETVEAGKSVSCRKGCGHCCRQLVPIAPAEARALARLVEDLPAIRRELIKRRFSRTVSELTATGLLEELRDRRFWQKGHGREVGLRYLAMRRDCPFLEEETCSIYADRPIACREYLVTSPAENCSSPDGDSVDAVRIPGGPVWPAVARLEQGQDEKLAWVPLILSLEYAREYPKDPEGQAESFLHCFVERVAGK